MERKRLLEKIERKALRIAELARTDCKGVPTAILNVLYNLFSNSVSTMLDEDSLLSVDQAADRYGVTTTTIHNWINSHGLTPPQPLEDQTRTRIPRVTIEELDKLYPHKKD